MVQQPKYQSVQEAYTKTKTETKYRTVQKPVGTEWVEQTIQREVKTLVTRQTNNVNSTLSGGTGDDYIVNEAANFVYNYASGEGFDTIVGFNATNKLNMTGGTYKTQQSGNDVIYKIGNGSIPDAKNTTRDTQPSWKLNGTTATYGNTITVSGVKNLNGILLKKQDVFIAGTSGYGSRGQIYKLQQESCHAQRIICAENFSLRLRSGIFLLKNFLPIRQEKSAAYGITN
ncbi:MAG: hypothetical protein II857_02450 [Selenomonadaceae bacterium]|nr:hypothetical protein [Selenomonadaceae bacterium]